MNIARALQKLVRARVKSREAGRLQAVMEKAIMAEVKHGGQRSAKRIIAGFIARGFPFVVEEKSVIPAKGIAYARWRLSLDGRRVRISANVNRLFRSVAVSYAVERPLTRKERMIDALQKAFYARYNAAAKLAYAPKPAKLSSVDQTALLIGELEADVNNGGFSQYLSNKGRRRAADALRALRRVGAVKTAGMLAAAMSASVTEKDLARLDSRFYSVPEDLAVLCTRRLGLTAEKSGTVR